VTWLAWRQFRAQAALALIATAVVVVVLVVTRDHVAAAAGSEDLSTGYESLRLLGTGLIGVPAFIGAFWGAPLVARELEMGTHRLAWTQSVTRRRWLATRLLVPGVASVVAVGVFSALFTWWSLPFDRLGNRVGTANFGQRGMAPVAYALFALALGALLGTIIRRTLPAMAATLVGFFVARFTFQWVVRPHLVAPLVTTRPTNTFGTQEGASTDGAWVLSGRTVDWAGRTVHDAWSGEVGRAMERVCGLTIDGPSDEAQRISCVNRLGLHDVVRVHPASHFWALQAWESVAFLAFAAVLVAACFWWLRRRTS
jgi:ABC-type transport system involved in multi-copper enzyme maturation permease subunit